MGTFPICLSATPLVDEWCPGSTWRRMRPVRCGRTSLIGRPWMPGGLEFRSLVHRYYDPATGQFLSVDPEVDETGTPYAFTGGDPVNNVDPSGELLCQASGACATKEDFEAHPGSQPAQFNCSLKPGESLTAFTGCGGGLVSGSLRSGSSADEARAAAEDSGYPIPDYYVAEPAANGEGWVFRAPGTTGNAGIIRVGEPDSQNPTGYVRFYNEAGQPLTMQGLPGSNPDTHLPLKGDEPEGGVDPELAYTSGCMTAGSLE